VHQANSRNELVILAVDPGKGKCGLAVVSASGSALHCETVPIASFSTVAQRLISEFNPVKIAVGDGTGSRDILKLLCEHVSKLATVLVDESHSTLEARKLWHELHPAKGLRRLVPPCLRTPDGPCDDLTAVVIGIRYWHKLHETENNIQGSEGVSCETGPL
jgi:RNase H-fold protein (predicted Holliday junction resolvase)